MDTKKAALVFKAFGDENRLRILQMLVNGERCACHILEEMNITQPTLSHHMKILCDAGVVIGRKEGKWMHYSISEEGMRCAEEYLKSFSDLPEHSKVSDCKCCEK